MAATAAGQSNTANNSGIYFIGIDRRYCAPKYNLTAAALFQSGYVATCGELDENGDTVNTMTREDIKEQLGISYATASRNNNRFKNAGIIEKSGVSTYVCKSDVQEGEEIKKWNCPTEILTETFEGEDDNGNKILITFTFSEGLVYALFYTLLPHTGENTRTLKMTFDEIADLLGLDPSTVSVAVRKLRMAKLIHFPNGWIGQNRYKKSRIQLKRGAVWFKREREYRALLKKKEEAKKVEPTSAPETAPKKAGISKESYYGILQAEAARKAEKTLAEVLNDVDYRKLHDELKQARFEFNEAIIHNDEAKQSELSYRIELLTEKKITVLANIGIKPEELEPEYYAECKDCNDTGTRQDGTACGCWKKRRPRGAPPGIGRNRTTKGTEYKN